LYVILNWNLEEETPNRDLRKAESRALESELWGRYVNSEWKGIKCLKSEDRDAWLAQSVEHATLDLGVMSSSPTLGTELTLKKKEDTFFERGC